MRLKTKLLLFALALILVVLVGWRLRPPPLDDAYVAGALMRACREAEPQSEAELCVFLPPPPEAPHCIRLERSGDERQRVWLSLDCPEALMRLPR